MLLPVIRIKLTQGQHAIINECDAPLILLYCWHCYIDPGNRKYAVRTRRKTELPGRKAILMHRVIHGGAAQHTDHINHNGLDNRRSNLRAATSSQNVSNQLGRAASGYKGVYKNMRCRFRPWRAAIADPAVQGKTRFIGSYATKEEAAMAYNKAAFGRFGHFACLNVIGQPLPAA